jgi:tetratricopeptide (TPR) repeat protein
MTQPITADLVMRLVAQKFGEETESQPESPLIEQLWNRIRTQFEGHQQIEPKLVAIETSKWEDGEALITLMRALAEALLEDEQFATELKELKQQIEERRFLTAIRENNKNGNKQDSETNQLGFMFYCSGEYQHAIELFQQSLEQAHKNSNRSDAALDLGGLGLSYHALNQYHRAIEYFQQQNQIHRELGNLGATAESLGNLGNAHYALSQYQQAIDSYQEALEIARKINDQSRETSSLVNLGATHYAIGEYQRANELYQKAAEIARKIGDRQVEAESLGGIGSMYYVFNQIQSAVDYYQQMLGNCARNR